MFGWRKYLSQQMASGETAMKYLKQQGMNAESNSLCKRSPNLIIRLCANIMQFCWPGRRPCVHSIKSFLGRFLPRHACNAIVLRFFLSPLRSLMLMAILLCLFPLVIRFRFCQRDTQMNNEFPTPTEEPQDIFSRKQRVHHHQPNDRHTKEYVPCIQRFAMVQWLKREEIELNNNKNSRSRSHRWHFSDCELFN